MPAHNKGTELLLSLFISVFKPECFRFRSAFIRVNPWLNFKLMTDDPNSAALAKPLLLNL